MAVSNLWPSLHNALVLGPQTVMALTRSEIIRNHPIGDALDSFRDVYSATCEKLTLAPSADTLNQIEENGNL